MWALHMLYLHFLYNRRSFVDTLCSKETACNRGVIGLNSVSGHGALQPVCENARLMEERGKRKWKRHIESFVSLQALRTFPCYEREIHDCCKKMFFLFTLA